MLQILILLCILLFAYVLFIDHKIELFVNQTQKDLDIAEKAALEIDKIKKKIDMQHKTILKTQQEIGPEESNTYRSEFMKIRNDMKADYKQAELEMLRAEVASPRSGPTVRSREAMIHMKNVINNTKI